ncbi:TetR/AcrR family transcriptional regulator [Amycolatopsis pigmentata]|uniref:TetR/AcrR family transcriptional regulator n=1 Tax=Amycolatopsis pigmentata TaxID=450801 RepID=A0ABW5FX59_9PSEU
MRALLRSLEAEKGSRMTSHTTTGRVNQKRRTYKAILDAAKELIRTDRAFTMLDVANAALVSEATAYRYFPDLNTLLQKAMSEQRPRPEEALASVAGSVDPVKRVTAATEYLLRHVLTFQNAVRATIAATIGAPQEAATTRRGLRFDLIDHALAPLAEAVGEDDPVLVQLKRDLSVVVGAESLFCLLDQCGLPPEEAIVSIVHTATTLTRAASREARKNKR